MSTRHINPRGSTAARPSARPPWSNSRRRRPTSAQNGVDADGKIVGPPVAGLAPGLLVEIDAAAVV